MKPTKRATLSKLYSQREMLFAETFVTDPSGGDPDPDLTFKKKPNPDPGPAVNKKPDPDPTHEKQPGSGSDIIKFFLTFYLDTDVNIIYVLFG